MKMGDSAEKTRSKLATAETPKVRAARLNLAARPQTGLLTWRIDRLRGTSSATAAGWIRIRIRKSAATFGVFLRFQIPSVVLFLLVLFFFAHSYLLFVSGLCKDAFICALRLREYEPALGRVDNILAERRPLKTSGWRDLNPRPLEPHSSVLPS